ncbi:FAD-dependent oxidoreductase [Halococcus agarilyticus]|uniref:FAD-dependent oxidoreductase n=1 Tax=Halococcus agarilyticus TaxID=1232219 RepID=UPI000A933FE5|nr:FAD-dependent oxidoreductase [Halococcus agarilyticus]
MTCSIAVWGGTPGDIAAAVRAAREGRDTVPVADGDHLGGMIDVPVRGAVVSGT